MFTAHVCFYCVSYAHLLGSNLRYQLGSQTDIFNWPTGASSSSCSNPILAMNSHQIHVQICTKFPLCTTLSLNIANISFVVRGCMEQILATKLRIDGKFQKKGCYIVRSKRFYSTLPPLEYIICVCSIEYCNSDMQKSFLHKNQSESDPIGLVSTVEDERLAGAEMHDVTTALNSLPALVVSLLFASTLHNEIIIYLNI
ncbi:Uncharacterized protein BM_BM2178 [Brugia malayi]|uniref:BMA-HOT-6 n=2 Tax=Brugia malayi TaxID=6279 RepID=A0A0H5S6D1_BRUMA|nr:Uncharacterized protein BM_BM2178 [Brugia malayi]CRZ24287.1 BMA-HOT-6 [Brugia malayi]VIO98507.1 Uncharacterized protein BM_BM2178 [Brugia malayi]